jgi:hypothetical protein
MYVQWPLLNRRKVHKFDTRWMTDPWEKISTDVVTVRSTQPAKLAVLQSWLTKSMCLGGMLVDYKVRETRRTPFTLEKAWGAEWDSIDLLVKPIVKGKLRSKSKPMVYGPWNRLIWEPEDRSFYSYCSQPVERVRLRGLRGGHMPRLFKNWCPRCRAYLSVEHKVKGVECVQNNKERP